MRPFAQPSFSASTYTPRRTPNKPNWTIDSDEVEQGCILWLGTPEETIASQASRGARPESIRNVKTGQVANLGMFEHPILAISRPLSDPSKLYFLPMTSLGGKSLQQRYHGRKSSYHQATFVPVTPAVNHPHHIAGDSRYRTLTLENGDTLERSTFINIRELYLMDWRDAQLYWGSNPTLRKSWKLDATSIRSVMRLATMHAGFKAEQQFRPRHQSSPRRSVITPTTPTRVSPLLPAATGLGIDIPRPVDSPLEGYMSLSAPTTPPSATATPVTKRSISASGMKLPPAPPPLIYNQAESFFPVLIASPPVMSTARVEAASNASAYSANIPSSAEDQRAPLLSYSQMRQPDDGSPLSARSSSSDVGFCCPVYGACVDVISNYDLFRWFRHQQQQGFGHGSQ